MMMMTRRSGAEGFIHLTVAVLLLVTIAPLTTITAAASSSTLNVPSDPLLAALWEQQGSSANTPAPLPVVVDFTTGSVMFTAWSGSVMALHITSQSKDTFPLSSAQSISAAISVPETAWALLAVPPPPITSVSSSVANASVLVLGAQSISLVTVNTSTLSNSVDTLWLPNHDSSSSSSSSTCTITSQVTGDVSQCSLGAVYGSSIVPKFHMSDNSGVGGGESVMVFVGSRRHCTAEPPQHNHSDLQPPPVTVTAVAVPLLGNTPPSSLSKEWVYECPLSEVSTAFIHKVDVLGQLWVLSLNISNNSVVPAAASASLVIRTLNATTGVLISSLGIPLGTAINEPEETFVAHLSLAPADNTTATDGHIRAAVIVSTGTMMFLSSSRATGIVLQQSEVLSGSCATLPEPPWWSETGANLLVWYAVCGAQVFGFEPSTPSFSSWQPVVGSPFALGGPVCCATTITEGIVLVGASTISLLPMGQPGPQQGLATMFENVAVDGASCSGLSVLSLAGEAEEHILLSNGGGPVIHLMFNDSSSVTLTPVSQFATMLSPVGSVVLVQNAFADSSSSGGGGRFLAAVTSNISVTGGSGTLIQLYATEVDKDQGTTMSSISPVSAMLPETSPLGYNVAVVSVNPPPLSPGEAEPTLLCHVDTQRKMVYAATSSTFTFVNAQDGTIVTSVTLPTAAGDVVNWPIYLYEQFALVFGLNWVVVMDVEQKLLLDVVTVCNVSTKGPYVAHGAFVVVVCSTSNGDGGGYDTAAANIVVLDSSSGSVFLDSTTLVGTSETAKATGLGAVVAFSYGAVEEEAVLVLVTDINEIMGFRFTMPVLASAKRHDNKTGTLLAVNATAINGTAASVLWTSFHNTFGEIWSSPSLSDGGASVLFFADGTDSLTRLFRLNAATGTVVQGHHVNCMTYFAGVRTLAYAPPLAAGGQQISSGGTSSRSIVHPSMFLIASMNQMTRLSKSYGVVNPPITHVNNNGATVDLGTIQILGGASGAVAYYDSQGFFSVANILSGQEVWQYPSSSTAGVAPEGSASISGSSSTGSGVIVLHHPARHVWDDGECLVVFISNSGLIVIANIFTGAVYGTVGYGAFPVSAFTVSPVVISASGSSSTSSAESVNNNRTAYVVTAATTGGVSFTFVVTPLADDQLESCRFDEVPANPNPFSNTHTQSASFSDTCLLVGGNESLCKSMVVTEGCRWCPALQYCSPSPCIDHCFEIPLSQFPRCLGQCSPCSSTKTGGSYCSASCNCFDLHPSTLDCTVQTPSQTDGSCAFCPSFGYCSNISTGGLECSCSVIGDQTSCETVFGGQCSWSTSGGGCQYGPCFSFLIRGFSSQPYFLFVVAVIKDVLALVMVNAMGSVVLRRIGIVRHRCNADHNRLPLSELALERPTQFTMEETLSFSSMSQLTEEERLSAINEELERDVGSILLTSSRSVGASAAGGAVKDYRTRQIQHQQQQHAASTDSASSISDSNRVPFRRGSAGLLPGSSGSGLTLRRLFKEDESASQEWQLLDEDPDEAVVNYDPEEYCREVLLPMLFDLTNIPQVEKKRQGERLLAYLLSEDLWISAHKILEQGSSSSMGRRPLSHMLDVVRERATDSVIVFTSTNVAGRVGHTLDTYLSTYVLSTLIVVEIFAWSLYIGQVVSDYSDQITMFEQWQLVVFRVANSGAVTSMSLVLVKYVLCVRTAFPHWRMWHPFRCHFGRPESEDVEDGGGSVQGGDEGNPVLRDLPPVASATRARFRYTSKVHILTWMYLLIEIPMLAAALCGMVMYLYIPIGWMIIGMTGVRISEKICQVLRRRGFTRRHPMWVALLRFVLEQQIPALALAITLQGCTNYFLLYLHRNLYELSYTSVISKEFNSRSAQCFVKELQQDFESILHQSASLVQWLSALVPGN